MSNGLNTTKFLTVLIDSNEGKHIIEVMRKAGACGCTRLIGELSSSVEDENTSDSQTILLSLIDSNPTPIINAIANAAMQDSQTKITVLLKNAYDYETDRLSVCNYSEAYNDVLINRSLQMKPNMKLIIIIINRVYTEELMSVARLAGAQGGTIIGARGTGTEEDAIFFGIRLAPEKEMILILAEENDTLQIVESIKTQPIFNERGNGIVFTLNVEQSYFFNDKQ